MLRLTGNLCEMGELDPEHIPNDGCRIQRLDGSVVTITGLTRAEVCGLRLFSGVTLNITDVVAGTSKASDVKGPEHG